MENRLRKKKRKRNKINERIGERERRVERVSKLCLMETKRKKKKKTKNEVCAAGTQRRRRESESIKLVVWSIDRVRSAVDRRRRWEAGFRRPVINVMHVRINDYIIWNTMCNKAVVIFCTYTSFDSILIFRPWLREHETIPPPPPPPAPSPLLPTPLPLPLLPPHYQRFPHSATRIEILFQSYAIANIRSSTVEYVAFFFLFPFLFWFSITTSRVFFFILAKYIRYVFAKKRGTYCTYLYIYIYI